MADETKQPQVFAAMSAVMADLAEVGISKNRKNTDQGWMFRGIDDVYNALANILAKNKLLIIPKSVTRTETTRTTQRGGTLFHVLLDVNYRFICTADNSECEIPAWGEAFDSGDKATPKALTAAYKYLLLQVFCIPVEGILDADDTSHDVASGKQVDKLRELEKKTKQEAKPAAKDPNFGKPIDVNELAEIALGVENANDDAVLRDIGKQVYKLFTDKRLKLPNATELAKTICAKRSQSVAGAAHKGFETMVGMFAEAGLITAAEANVYRTTTRSRLNLPIESAAA